ncbi:MAG: MGMT family protein [Patescibacteria group bacterium]
MTFTEQVYTLVRLIPAGKVATYGAIAAALGRPGATRAVGTALKKNPHSFLDKKCAATVPCHRVIASNGLGGFNGGLAAKQRLLAKEGSIVPGNRIG